jgi:hypothetical protein
LTVSNSTSARLVAQLESDTEYFRDILARRHENKAQAATLRGREALRARVVGRDTSKPGLVKYEPGVSAVEWHPLVEGRRGALSAAELLAVNAGTASARVGSVGRVEVQCAVPAADWDAASDASEREVERRASSSHVWHRRRANGQRTRFSRVKGCGGRITTVFCRGCGKVHAERPEGCGVGRVCRTCGRAQDKRRQARFGRARARRLLELSRPENGERTSTRRGFGRFTDKMVTLTVPHLSRASLYERYLRIRDDIDPRWESQAKHLRRVVERASDDVQARIAVAFAAWPLFLRALREYFKSGDIDPRLIPYSRAFEWTPGKDGRGHPHFHVWLLSPFIGDPASMNGVSLMRELWGRALEAVGVPMGERLPVVGLKMFRDFDVRATRELLKQGARGAIELARLYNEDAPDADARGWTRGSNAFTYSSGWTMAEFLEDETRASRDARASLYEALEARRLVQASKGFYLHDEPPACSHCHEAGHFDVSWSSVDELRDLNGDTRERAPPA